MVFHRYASPMLMMDKMIQSQRFTEFVNKFVDIYNEELEDHTKWEFWLHRVFDMGYKDYLDATSTDTTARKMPSQNELKNTVKDSMEMLNGFCLS